MNAAKTLADTYTDGMQKGIKKAIRIADVTKPFGKILYSGIAKNLHAYYRTAIQAAYPTVSFAALKVEVFNNLLN